MKVKFGVFWVYIYIYIYALLKAPKRLYFNFLEIKARLCREDRSAQQVLRHQLHKVCLSSRDSCVSRFVTSVPNRRFGACTKEGSLHHIPHLILRQRSNFVRPTIGDKIVETLYSNRVTQENKRIRAPPLFPPFKVGVFVVFYRQLEHRHNIAKRGWGRKSYISSF